MKHLRLKLVVLAAVGVIAAGVGSALAATTPASGGVKISVAQTGLGRILVNGRGRTLYLFRKDTHGKSTCNGKCASFWPPVIATGKPRPLAGVRASLLGTVRRADGRLQVTYNHHPLYTFVKDSAKGQTNGEGLNVFGAEWYAVSTAGAAVENDNTSSMGGGGYSQGSGGYGY